MHGIVSLLDKQYDQKVKSLWSELEESCELKGVLETPFPHFSWQVADGYEEDGIEQTLISLSREIEPFEINAVGVGVFSGDTGVLPVIYIPVLRKQVLNMNHRLIWSKLECCAVNPKELYHAYNWMPHITLAYKDVTKEKLGCAMKLLGYKEINWKIPINNIAHVFLNEGETGKLKNKLELKGQNDN